LTQLSHGGLELSDPFPEALILSNQVRLALRPFGGSIRDCRGAAVLLEECLGNLMLPLLGHLE
jgi:hypothetical protein